MIFVFGSNLAGRHGRGAALAARRDYGAQYGVGRGRTGEAYAIPTKDQYFKPCSLSAINSYVQEFLDYARRHPELEFNVTRVGCGLAGYTEKEIRPMFLAAPKNCHFNWLDNYPNPC